MFCFIKMEEIGVGFFLSLIDYTNSETNLKEKGRVKLIHSKKFHPD